MKYGTNEAYSELLLQEARVQPYHCLWYSIISACLIELSTLRGNLAGQNRAICGRIFYAVETQNEITPEMSVTFGRHFEVYKMMIAIREIRRNIAADPNSFWKKT